MLILIVNAGTDEYDKAAGLCSKVCGHDAKRWEDWIFTFAERRQLQAIIPYVPIDTPTLDRVVYDMIMAHFLAHDHQVRSLYAFITGLMSFFFSFSDTATDN